MIDAAFLAWFRDETERAWASYDAPTFDDFVQAGVGGLEWQRGTRWTGGLRDDELDAIEAQRGLRFPPDYRLFLRHLHATDRPRVGARYGEDGLEPFEGPGFHDWLRGAAAIDQALEDVIVGLCFDVEHNALWREAWGARPDAEDARAQVVRAQVAAAPRLAPLFGHRHLVVEPYQAGNPVLSIHQSDVIGYGSDLQAYLVTELGQLIGADAPPAQPLPEVAFWGELLR